MLSIFQDLCMTATKTNRTAHHHSRGAEDAFGLPQAGSSSAPALPHLLICSGSVGTRTSPFQTTHREQPFSTYCMCLTGSVQDDFAAITQCTASGRPLCSSPSFPLHLANSRSLPRTAIFSPKQPLFSEVLQIVPPAPAHHYWR